MKLIGDWMKSLQDLTLPHPCELVGEMPSEVRAAVVRYLLEGSDSTQYRGYSWCRFHCGADHETMGSYELTDGEWIWPKGLVHYVRDHGVLLPEEFVAAATSGRSPSGLSIPEPTVRESELLAYWIDWSTPRRSPAYRQRLAAALEAAKATETVVIQRKVDKLTEEMGISDGPCMFAGCNERALLGARICARHSFWNGGLSSLTTELYDLPAP